MNLKMVSICSSEKSVDFQRTTWHYITENKTLPNHCCENITSSLLSYASERAEELPVLAWLCIRFADLQTCKAKLERLLCQVMEYFCLNVMKCG
jgi:hypothetical protein